MMGFAKKLAAVGATRINAVLHEQLRAALAATEALFFDRGLTEH